ncbi:endothelial cell-selective adhesion molecule, partial [Numida meleagris]|uniref:endothelial cell-selective adhesion molecule n=1 Tax=Numida meleagris TaxID=8996 RepID=UPI000B3D9809
FPCIGTGSCSNNWWGLFFCWFFLFFVFCFILVLYNWHPGLRRVPFSCWAGVCSAVLEVHVGTGSVYSVEGEGAVLPAWYTSSSQKKPYISWILKKAAAEHFQILTYLDGEVKVEETELKPRVGFLHPVLTHNISLFINATREQDSGQYICSVNVVDDIISPIRNMAIINLTVLVPPAPPACRLKGSPTVGANVTLSCASQKGKPSPTYRWQRQEPTKQVFFPPAQDRAKGTLKLTNLSLDMSGLYECEAENRAGSAKCSIILEVHSSDERRGRHRGRCAGLRGRAGHRRRLRSAGARLPEEETRRAGGSGQRDQGRRRGPQNPHLDADPPCRHHLQDQHLVLHRGCPGQTLRGLPPLRHCLGPHRCWQLPGTPPGQGASPRHQRGPLAPTAAPCPLGGAAPLQPGAGRSRPRHGARPEPGRLLGVTPPEIGCSPWRPALPAFGAFLPFFPFFFLHFFVKTPGAAGLVLQLFNGCGSCPALLWGGRVSPPMPAPRTGPAWGGGGPLFYMYRWKWDIFHKRALKVLGKGWEVATGGGGAGNIFF